MNAPNSVCFLMELAIVYIHHDLHKNILVKYKKAKLMVIHSNNNKVTFCVQIIQKLMFKTWSIWSNNIIVYELVYDTHLGVPGSPEMTCVVLSL